MRYLDMLVIYIVMGSILGYLINGFLGLAIGFIGFALIWYVITIILWRNKEVEKYMKKEIIILIMIIFLFSFIWTGIYGNLIVIVLLALFLIYEERKKVLKR